MDVLAPIQEIVSAQSSPFLMEISCASLLWCCKHSFPIGPVDVKIRGVKVLCSLSIILLEYSHLILFILVIAIYICWSSRSPRGRVSIRVKDPGSSQRMLIVGSPRTREHGYLIRLEPFLAVLPIYLEGRARSQHHYISYAGVWLLNLSVHCDVG